jgi:hypothetical protein
MPEHIDGWISFDDASPEDGQWIQTLTRIEGESPFLVLIQGRWRGDNTNKVMLDGVIQEWPLLLCWRAIDPPALVLEEIAILRREVDALKNRLSKYEDLEGTE